MASCFAFRSGSTLATTLRSQRLDAEKPLILQTEILQPRYHQKSNHPNRDYLLEAPVESASFWALPTAGLALQCRLPRPAVDKKASYELIDGRSRRSPND